MSVAGAQAPSRRHSGSVPRKTGLKTTYETFLAGSADTLPGLETRRNDLLKALRRELEPLQRFHNSMICALAPAGISLHNLLRKSIELSGQTPVMNAVEKERIPTYQIWLEHRQRLEKLTEILADIQPDGVFANHPLRLLHARITREDRPLELVSKGLDDSLVLLDRLEQAFRATEVPIEHWETMERADRIARYAIQLEFLTSRKLMGLLDSKSDLSSRFAQAVRQFQGKLAALEKRRDDTRGWKRKLPPDETREAFGS
jgi:hypothetical protein